MKIVTVHLPEAYVEAIDELVRRKVYLNRAEAIRMAVRDLIRREIWWLEESREKF
jgi:antitoxin ParD1/3/4